MEPNKHWKKIQIPGSARAIEDNEKLWRYMSFGKFINILLSDTIFFNRLDLFSDEQEGRLAELTKGQIEAGVTAELLKTSHSKILTPFFSKVLHDEEESIRALFFVNCWNQREFEDYGLWCAYANSSESVAICATLRNITNAMRSNFSVGAVEYIDYAAPPDATILQMGFPYRPLFKRQNFSFENEVRFFHVHHKSQAVDGTITVSQSDRSIDIKNDQLIGLPVPFLLMSVEHEVVLPRRAPTYIRDNIQSIYNLKGIELKLRTSEVF